VCCFKATTTQSKRNSSKNDWEEGGGGIACSGRGEDKYASWKEEGKVTISEKREGEGWIQKSNGQMAAVDPNEIKEHF